MKGPVILAHMDVVINKCFGGFGLSEAACKWLQNHGFEGNPNEYFNINRAHPLLVRCVTELGESANGCHAKLELVAGHGTFYILDYDGKESLTYEYNWVHNGPYGDDE